MFVELKSAPQVVFAEKVAQGANYIRFRRSPTAVIAMGARAKAPGEGMTGRPVELSVVEVPEHGAVADTG